MLCHQLPAQSSVAPHISWDPTAKFSLELVLPGAADFGREPLGQLLQAAGVLELNLSLPAEELLEILKQLQPRL